MEKLAKSSNMIEVAKAKSSKIIAKSKQMLIKSRKMLG